MKGIKGFDEVTDNETGDAVEGNVNNSETDVENPEEPSEENMHRDFDRNEDVEDDLESYCSYDDGESGEESIEDLDEIPNKMEEDLINEANNRVDFAEEWKEWALSRNIPLTQVLKLLLILRRNCHQDLPKTAVTLLKTKHNFELVTLENNFSLTSQFVCFGMEKGLWMCLNPDLHPN